jgi:hypothetical protein
VTVDHYWILDRYYLILCAEYGALVPQQLFERVIRTNADIDSQFRFPFLYYFRSEDPGRFNVARFDLGRRPDMPSAPWTTGSRAVRFSPRSVCQDGKRTVLFAGRVDEMKLAQEAAGETAVRRAGDHPRW